MNFQRVQRKNRKAISPVLATVILIAITLIAAIAIAGFVFGLFGTFTSTARVQASVTGCTATYPGPAAPEVCTLILTNSGNANTVANNGAGYCSLTYAGTTHSGTVAGAGTITAGTSLPGVTCTVAGSFAPPGSQVTGQVVLANGGNALFSGTGS